MTKHLGLVKSMPIRQAIRHVLKVAYIAKETFNKELYLDCRDWLRSHIKQRNSGKLWLYN